MEMLAHNPADGVYPATSDYVPALEVRAGQRMLFVSGTMGLDPAGAPGGTLSEQLELVGNIRVILASAGMTVNNIVRRTNCLRDSAYAEENAAARVAALGGRAIPTTAIVVQTLESDRLIEPEVIAVA